MPSTNKITFFFSSIWIALLVSTYSPSIAQQDEIRTRILFLLDGSGSMQNAWNDLNNETKMYSAKRILNHIVDSLEQNENVEIGLRVYGHQSSPSDRNCKDTKLEVGFSKNSSQYIKDKLNSIRPKGITPIAYALERAGEDFPKVKSRNIIILMTDGEESCEGDPCQVAMMLEKHNVVLKHFVIGIGVQEESEKAFDCIGTYFRASDSYSLKSILELVIGRILNKTTTQVNLLDQYNDPSESDVNMTFYNSFNDLVKYNFYHTLNPRGIPDTISVDPVHNYDIEIHTIPSIRRNDNDVTLDKHNIIEFISPQGELEVVLQGKIINNNLNDMIKCLVKAKNSEMIINVQDLNTTEKYLVNKYDLEFLTLPRTIINNVDVSQNKTTTIQLPSPGIASLVKKFEVYGGIFISKNNKLEKIYQLEPEAKNEIIVLLPGSYTLVYRPKFSKSMHKTKTIDFEINSGESISLIL